MAKLSKYQTLQKKVISSTNNLFKTKDGKELYEALSHGQNSYLRFDRIESSAMDPSWIKRIEEVIPDLNDIVSNPKRTIQTLSEVVEVEKAKKTSRESVQHLASHTQYVKSIDDEGNVTPSKILNIYNDDFFAIYENKFIATLVRRLFLFVEKRYQYIITQATLRDVELLYFKNKTIIDGSEIEIETKIRYSKPALDSAEDKMKDFLRRIEDVRKYLRFFAGSEFMRILHRERDVRNPILQTNIIRKNPKYRNCYHLWQFLNSYMESGVELKVEEKYSRLNEEELNEINKVLTINFLALKGGDAPKEESKTKIFRPRILKTFDDEMFNPDAKFTGPVEFVRVDDKYREYKEGLRDLNPHPTKPMAEYYKEEYEDNKARKEETKQVDSLIKRKEQEHKKYVKKQEELLVKEQEDLEMISDLAEQQILEEQEAKLKPYRDALAGKGEEEKIEELPKEETPVEEAPVEEEAPKKSRGGARPGAGRKPKAKPEVIEEASIEEPVITEEPRVHKDYLFAEELPTEPGAVVETPKEEPSINKEEKKGRGGARVGAGRKKKEKPIEEPVKKPRGGARPGAGRKPKPKEEPVKEPEVVKEEPKAEKSKSKKERRQDKKAEREAKKAKILKTNSSRKGKKFGRR